MAFLPMRSETPETDKPLRYGFTTGACATAASTAAALRLLAGVALEQIEIVLPRGQRPLFRLEYCRLTETGAEAATVKDAGDDPDVTHGASIFARIELRSPPGVRFHAGSGVGIVTRPGLPVPVGEPAINPTPRRMMVEHLARLSVQQGYSGGFEVTVGIENGAELASKTRIPGWASSAGCRYLAPPASSDRFLAPPISLPSGRPSMWPAPTQSPTSPLARAPPANKPCERGMGCRISH